MKIGVLSLCGFAVSFAGSGCSQNVGSDSPIAAASTPTADGISGAPQATSTPVAPTATTAPPQPTAPSNVSGFATPIQWESSYDSALAKARATQKPIMIDFFATWCGPCKMLDEKIYPSPEVSREAQNFISLKVDVDQQQELANKFKVEGLPSIVFLNSSGQEIHRVVGITGEISDFVNTMKTALSQQGAGTAA